MQIEQNKCWTDYELIDTGNFEKLERFGKYVIARPEPQALWDKSLSEKKWQEMLHAQFIRSKGTGNQSSDLTERGEWKLKPGMVPQWFIRYNFKDLDIKLRLGLTAFKHLGIFPSKLITGILYMTLLRNSRLTNLKYLICLPTQVVPPLPLNWQALMYIMSIR